MTIGQTQPDKFVKGQRLTAAGLNGVVDAVVAVVRRMFGPQLTQPLHLQVMMKADLLAAPDCQTDPSTAAAYVMRRTSSGDMETTDREITIVNRFQEISVDAGTYAKAEWIDGEWQLYAADCATDASFSTGDVVSE